MCGLFGVFGPYMQDKHRTAFRQLMWCSTLRGYDATGMIQITGQYGYKVGEAARHNIKAMIYKGAVIAPQFMATKEFATLVDDKETRALFGHCRSKTIGENSHNNAHPFDFDRVVGMHNGTLSYKYPYKGEYQTDSQALYRSINDHGIEETIQVTDGAYALSWFDKTDNTIHFLRNKERDLWFSSEKFTDTVFWASEPGMLRWILSRNAIDYNPPVQLTPHTHVIFDLATASPAQSIKIVKDVKKKEETLIASPFGDGDSQTWCDYLRDANIPLPDTAENAEPLSTVRKSARLPPTALSTKTSKDYVYRGFRGIHVTAEGLKDKFEAGCVYCGHEAELGEGVRWLNNDDYLCTECKNDPVFNYSGFKTIDGVTSH